MRNILSRILKHYCRDSCQDSCEAPTALLQYSCQETLAKMIQYFSFILQCTTAIILAAITCHIYSIIKIANETINDLLPEVSRDLPKSDMKRQKLIESVLTGNSKQYLGKVYTEEQVNKLSSEEVDKVFSNYEAKLSGQMVKSLGKSIIKMYSMRACAVLGMTNQDALRPGI